MGRTRLTITLPITAPFRGCSGLLTLGLAAPERYRVRGKRNVKGELSGRPTQDRERGVRQRWNGNWEKRRKEKERRDTWKREKGGKWKGRRDDALEIRDTGNGERGVGKGSFVR